MAALMFSLYYVVCRRQKPDPAFDSVAYLEQLSACLLLIHKLSACAVTGLCAGVSVQLVF